MAFYNNGSAAVINPNEGITTPAAATENRTTWVVFVYNTVFISSWVLVAAGIVGNCLVIGDLFRKCKKQGCCRAKRNSSFLLLHLAVTDLLVILTTSVVSIYKKYDIKNACIPTFAVYVAIHYCSIFTLSLLSYERYRNFVYPFDTNVTPRKVMFWLCLVWILSFAFSVPLFLPHLRLGPHDCIFAPDLPERKIYYSWLFLSQYLAPLVFITTVNLSTIRYVKRNTLPKAQSSKSETASNKPSCTVFNCKVFRILLCMLGVFAICMLPQHIVNFILEFTDENTLTNSSLSITAEACYVGAVLMNAVADPFLYGAIKRKFNLKIPAWIPCRKRSREAAEITTTPVRSSPSTKTSPMLNRAKWRKFENQRKPIQAIARTKSLNLTSTTKQSTKQLRHKPTRAIKTKTSWMSFSI